MTPHFQNPEMLGCLLLVAMVAAAVLSDARWRRAAYARLGRRSDANEERARTSRDWMLVAGLLLLVVALARPVWRPRTEPLSSDGRDVVFVLDVSRSMLARDREPDRLSSARLAIRDLVERLRPGDRVGLVVFAGSSLIVCPLTTDLVFFRKALDEAGPTSVAYGGTRIGDALRKTADKLLGGSDRRGFQDVILLTDGGDQESEIGPAVDALNDDGAAILVIGLGSDAEGARIPDGDRFVVYRGREVWTRQETPVLEQITQRARTGLYLNGGTRALDLPDVYRRFTEHSAPTRVTHRPTDRWEEEFPWFLGAALLALLAAGGAFRTLRRSTRVAAAVALSSGPVAAAVPPTPTADVSENRFEEDAARYLAAARTATDARAEARQLYNAATCWLQAAAQVEQALTQMEQLVRDAGQRMPAQMTIAPAEEDEEGFGPDAAAMLEQSVRLYETALLRQPDFPPAARNLEIARARWHKAAAEQEKQQQEADSADKEPTDMKADPNAEPSEDDEAKPDDNEGEDADKAKSGDSNTPPSDTSLADLLNQNIPPPNVSPQDILRKEVENNQQRSAPSDPKAKAVEKNW